MIAIHFACTVGTANTLMSLRMVYTQLARIVNIFRRKKDED